VLRSSNTEALCSPCKQVVSGVVVDDTLRRMESERADHREHIRTSRLVKSHMARYHGSNAREVFDC
jgi:hypothetical protein